MLQGEWYSYWLIVTKLYGIQCVLYSTLIDGSSTNSIVLRSDMIQYSLQCGVTMLVTGSLLLASFVAILLSNFLALQFIMGKFSFIFPFILEIFHYDDYTLRFIFWMIFYRFNPSTLIYLLSFLHYNHCHSSIIITVVPSLL